MKEFKSNARETWHAILVSFADIYPKKSGTDSKNCFVPDFFCGRITVYICGVISLKILLRLRCKTYSFSQFLELECSHHIKSSGIGDAH